MVGDNVYTWPDHGWPIMIMKETNHGQPTFILQVPIEKSMVLHHGRPAMMQYHG